MTDTTIHPDVSQFLNQDPIPLYVDGAFIHGGAGALEVVDPSTGGPLGRVSTAGAEDVARAVEAAGRAFPKWSGMSPNERAVLLHRLSERLEAENEALAQLEALDVGKPIVNARGFDVPFGAEGLRYFADLSIQATYDIPLPVKNIEARVHRESYGVCGFIFPWNFPLTLLCWGVGPALAAGNTVVVKCSEQTPLSSLYFAKLAADAGLPPGVVNIITGTGQEAGQPLAEHPQVKRMAFTGSTTVGKRIGRICGERLAPCKLELGGKGAALVFDDVDIDAAAEGLAGAITLNTGQVCCTATRWFLHEAVYDVFVAKVSDILRNTRIGPGMSEETAMGPLVSERQMKRVVDYYERGVKEGATPVMEMERPQAGQGGNGYFVTPHLLAGDDENVCFREEVFGPTAYLVKFRDEDEAVARVNKVAYGLANSVWTSDLKRAQEVAERVVAGNTWINAHNVFAYGLPYGGVNLSGMGGGVNSPETFNDYLRNQTIARPL